MRMGLALRHAAAIAVTAFAVLPIVFVVSAALDPIGTLSSVTLVPRGGDLLPQLLAASTRREDPEVR